MLDALNTISPLDGRYHGKTAALRPFFSEMALMRYRVLVEVEYLLALARHPQVDMIQPLPHAVIDSLRNLYKGFTLEDAKTVKRIEQRTRHDVKAIEYFLQQHVQRHHLPVPINAIHFALTSEDVNNISFTLMWKDALHTLYLPSLFEVIKQLASLAIEHKTTPLLSLTHGQSATPTTIGKELKVFVKRLERLHSELSRHPFLGKLNGATGTWAAHTIAYPTVDWQAFSAHFIRALGLYPNNFTTQIESHDAVARSYHGIARVNTVLIDLCRDVWTYVSRGIFIQKRKEGEVGSSTMPHKINPIDFENAEGNLGISTALAEHLARKLPISRMQRDLSDSTVLRNQGVIMGHAYIALTSILQGLSRTAVHPSRAMEELRAHPEVLAEAIQTVLRKHGATDAYEQIKIATQGTQITLEDLHALIRQLAIPPEEKERLLTLMPEQYTGLAPQLVDQ